MIFCENKNFVFIVTDRSLLEYKKAFGTIQAKNPTAHTNIRGQLQCSQYEKMFNKVNLVLDRQTV